METQFESVADIQADDRAKRARITAARMREQTEKALAIAKKDVERLEVASRQNDSDQALMDIRILVPRIPERLLTRGLGNLGFAGGQSVRDLMNQLITDGLKESERIRDRAGEKLPAAREALKLAQKHYDEYHTS